MKMPLTLRFVVALAMLFLSASAYCADENVMLRYACVESKFRARVPLPIAIDSGEELSTTAIHALAPELPKELRLALAETADAAISIIAVNSRKRIDPAAFYDAFVSHVAAQLKQHVDVERCGSGEDMEGALYDASSSTASPSFSFRSFSDLNGGGWIESGLATANPVRTIRHSSDG